MPASTLLKPDLYAPVPTQPPPQGPATGDPCVLKGGRCLCGYLFFPMQTYGCEDCGAYGDLLQPADLRAAGTLVATARVHLHKGEGRQAPFIVSSVRLDDGPVLRTLLDHPVDSSLPPPGTRVQAVLVATDQEHVLDLRFRPQVDARGGENT